MVEKISETQEYQSLSDLEKLDREELIERIIRLQDERKELDHFVNEMALMRQNQKEGDIDWFMPVQNFSGVYLTMAEGVNEQVGDHIAVKKRIVEIIRHFGDGDFSFSMEQLPGKKAFITTDINLFRTRILALFQEIESLTRASSEGTFSFRADPSQYSGDWAALIRGINKMLDEILLPIGEGNRILEQISGGDLREKVEIKYHGDHEKMKEAINGVYSWLIDLITYVTRLSEGDLSADMAKASEHDQIHQYLINLRENIKALVMDANRLSQAAFEGKLDTRADVTKHQGDFKKIVEGVNSTLDAVIGPLNVAAEYVDRISKGDIPTKITDSYNGDFNEIKNNLNGCIDAIALLVADVNMLSEAAVKGVLKTRADETKHQGDFQKVIKGVNDTLDSVITPLNDISAVLKRMLVNDNTRKMPDTYPGDYADLTSDVNQVMNRVNAIAEAIIKIGDGDLSQLEGFQKIGKRSNEDIIMPAVIRTLENLKVLQNEFVRLTQASQAGQLSQRGKPEQFKGAYADIISGTNQMLDAILLPIGEGNRVLAQISDGKIDELIAQTYKGDHEKMKIAVNNVASVLQNLQNEITRLTDASKQGQLSQRGKPEQFKGAYADIIRGTNQMLDAILQPIREGNRVLAQIKGGNLREKVEIDCHGDHEKMKNAINGVYSWLSDLINYVTQIANGDMTAEMQKASDKDQIYEHLIKMRENIKALVSDANVLSAAAIEGRLKTRADATKHQGDYRKIVEGVNATLDAVIHPVMEAMRIADLYAKADFSAMVDEKLVVSGDFINFKSSLNNIGINITTAIKEIQRVADQYANGNFTASFDESVRIEGNLTTIKTSLNNIGTQISTAINLVNQKISTLAASAEEANASIEEVTAGTQKIAENTGVVSSNADSGTEGITQVLRAMEDLNVTVSSVSQKTEQVSANSSQVNELAQKGVILSQNSEKSMKEINLSAGEVDQIVKDINSQMAEIGKIVRLISDIASQTNLLALNAAIEAARAGDAGRGFAVVASEVKALAQESRQSAEGIEDMISQLQQKAEKANQAMIISSRTIEEGSLVIGETVKAFDQIAGSIANISQTIMEVASASEEQAASVQEVTASISEVSGLVQNTSREASDAAAATQEASASIAQISTIISNVNNVVVEISEEMSRFRV